MTLSSKAKKIYAQLSDKAIKLGELKKMAKAIKVDHELAMELWSTKALLPRKLAILIMDKKLLSQALIDRLDEDMQVHTAEEQNQLMGWLMANQLTKDKKTIGLMESWEYSSSSLQRRIFWYYQARLRWTGQTPPENTADLLAAIEANLMKEAPEVQWAMNFTAGWIGIYDEIYRTRCIALGKKTGLYRDEVVSKGCTPSYLPAFIATEVDKRNK